MGQHIQLNDGSEIRKLFNALPGESSKETLERMHRSAMNQFGDKIQSLQNMIMKDETPCICGSGKKFKDCHKGMEKFKTNPDGSIEVTL